jgi:dTDP-4-dehydrorhamnose 3,5-epimerase
MEFEATPIEGVHVVRPRKLVDERGFFARVSCEQELADQGLVGRFVQANTGVSARRGTLRGLHLQRPPHEEAKLVRCTRGRVWDVAVDLRPGSPTRTRWFGLELDADEHTMLYVPPGCAHGYLTLTDGAEVLYLTSAAYAPEAATGRRWDDPAFGIEWPAAVEVVSEQDRSWPLLGDEDEEAA